MSLFRYVTDRRNIYSVGLSNRRFHDVPPVEINVEIIQTRMSATGTFCPTCFRHAIYGP
jgi:hypothetical protein